ncbi:peptide-methionine (S)-S-oxide reductase MsrA [Halalkalicoccus jeotgali]|uniref:Peptide methionine sulfoxide reductase MsrA n=1 Tax=Halalkalicoccus jeotgali (strain DSM 18796 / CECT 7217 / JCM 14584 / KCTC 4019 / B3) TaxID=795797 RepID=D8J5C3_HALJB|nr:peptide-methionine (S)-S-oxide reductase MsrA [Halalkalicoccus jeotgali]ADJ15619.1 methionine sulfoxide reductase A [Halalkalicoccus jeotgali B3]ELY36303.1 methionine sulfoxide reductase A [Halalkalicoccus jeotgali B3]
MGESVATVAGGCFWCIEAVFEELDGVVDVTSGYCGGHVEEPTYEAVCSGETGHAEAVRLTYDDDRLSYPKLLEVFFTVHDPTTLNRQGPDVGSQYRSAIFYHDERQREIAESFVADLEQSGAYEDPIVTEIEPLETFYEAEPGHQDYYENNPENRYCTVTIEPKLAKLRERFEAELRAP